MALSEISLNGSDWKVLPMMPSEWEWKRVWESPAEVYPSLWIPAQVPGTVQDDARDAGLTPDFAHDLNSRACEWTSERDWAYLKEFETPLVPEGGVVRLHFEGVDFKCRVYLNGQHLGDHEGMYDAFEFDVTSLLAAEGPNRLVVLVEHAPREVGQIGRTSDVRLWKARFAYDWDWCVRLVPIGIWDSVSLQVTGPAHVRDVRVATRLAEDYSRADVGLTVDVAVGPARGSCRGLQVRAEIYRDGIDVGSAQSAILAAGASTGHSLRIGVDSPQLWWPNGHGDQPLYEAIVSLFDETGRCLDRQAISFGIRQVRAVPNDGAPEGALPYVIEVNGKRIFLKGWNWAPIQQLYGREMPEHYERWIRLAKEAHCTFLRVWGGGLLEKKVFYDLCDRFGILVWQEFIQSSSGIDNRPDTSHEYLVYIRDQATKMIPRRRNHPSLIIWCGGNELMHDDWRPLDETHPALGVLGDCVRRLDPERIYLPTSASGPTENARVDRVGEMHDVHGPWLYLGQEEHYKFYNTIDPLLHSEFGVEGAANLDAMRRSNTEALLWPPDATNPLWMHKGSWWINRDKVEGLFGPIGDLESFVRASQLLQAEGLRYAIEANRRRKWRCAGTSPWQFNESWPNVSCTNVVDYYGQPRPAYWWCRRAYEPVHPSARYAKLGWQPGETFQAEVWLNNSLGAIPGAAVTWEILDLAGEVLARGGENVDAPANSALQVATVRWTVGKLATPIFLLRLRAAAGGATSDPVDYLFSAAEGPIFAPLLDAPKTALQVTRAEGSVLLENTGDAVALFVSLADAGGGWAQFDRNYLNLAPGEQASVALAPADAQVAVSAWNAEGLERP